MRQRDSDLRDLQRLNKKRTALTELVCRKQIRTGNGRLKKTTRSATDKGRREMRRIASICRKREMLRLNDSANLG